MRFTQPPTKLRAYYSIDSVNYGGAMYHHCCIIAEDGVLSDLLKETEMRRKSYADDLYFEADEFLVRYDELQVVDQNPTWRDAQASESHVSA